MSFSRICSFTSRHATVQNFHQQFLPSNLSARSLTFLWLTQLLPHWTVHSSLNSNCLHPLTTQSDHRLLTFDDINRQRHKNYFKCATSHLRRKQKTTDNVLRIHLYLKGEWVRRTGNITLFWDLTPCSSVLSTNILQKSAASIVTLVPLRTLQPNGNCMYQLL